MQISNEQPRGTVRRWVDQFKVRDYEAAHAAVEGLTAAGFDVDVKPFTPFYEKTGVPRPELTYQTITVYRKEG